MKNTYPYVISLFLPSVLNDLVLDFDFAGAAVTVLVRLLVLLMEVVLLPSAELPIVLPAVLFKAFCFAGSRDCISLSASSLKCSEKFQNALQ